MTFGQLVARTREIVRETFRPGPSRELLNQAAATCRVNAAANRLELLMASDKIGAVARGFRKGSRRKKKA